MLLSVPIECFPLEIHKSVDDYSVEGPRQERASLETLWDDYGNRPASNGQDDSSNKYVRDVAAAEHEPAEYTSSESGELNDEPEDQMGGDDESESERSTETLAQPNPTHELLTTFPAHFTVVRAPATVGPGLEKFRLATSGYKYGVGADSALSPDAKPLSSISYGPGGVPTVKTVSSSSVAGTAGTGAVLLGSRVDSGNRADAGSNTISHSIAPLAPSTLSKHKEMTEIGVVHAATAVALGAKSSSKSGGLKAEERAVISSNLIYVGRATFHLPAKSAAVGKTATALGGSGLKSSKAVNSVSVLKSRKSSSKIPQPHESKSLFKRKAGSGDVPVEAGAIGGSGSEQGSTLKPDQKPSSVTKVLGDLFQSKSTGVAGAAGVGAGAGVGLASVPKGSTGSKSLSQPGTTVPPSPLAIPKAESAAAGATAGGGAGAVAASPVSNPAGETPSDSDSSSSSSTLMLIIKGLVGVVGAAGAVSGVAYVVQKRKKEPPVEEETPLLPPPPPKEPTPEPVVEEKVEPPPELPPPEPKIEPPPPLPEPDEPVQPEVKPEPEGVSGDEEPPPPKPEPPKDDIEQLGLRLQESSSSDEDEEETAPPPEPEPAPPVQPPPPEPEPVQPPPPEPEPPKPTTNWQPLRKPTSFHQQFGGT